jgi:pimeloyl-ACP methyl ester carboxylesterase
VASDFVEIDWRGRAVHIEHEWLARENPAAPLMVFLHEGLGSVAMWKEFPQRLCAALGCRGLVYSRPGYGRSSPRATGELWQPDFMHQQAHEVLPAFLRALDIDTSRDRPWLFGHSDGGSIALLHGAAVPERTAGVIALAPHVMVEAVAVTSIAAAREAYLHADLRQRLARYHDDPDSAFWGWNRIWLDPRFSAWAISDEIAAITCPVLAVQGTDDEYGTLAQIRGIAQHFGQTELLELRDCGHSPHRDQPEALIAAVTKFFQRQHRDMP